MADDLIQAAMKECGLDFTDLADDKETAQSSVVNNVISPGQLPGSQVVFENKDTGLSQVNKLVSVPGLRPNQPTMPFPVILKNNNQPIFLTNSNKSQIVFPQKSVKPAVNDLEKRTQTFIIQKSQAQPLPQMKNLKNIKILNIKRPNSPVVINPKTLNTPTLSTDLSDRKIVKVILKPTTTQVPLSNSAKLSSPSSNNFSAPITSPPNMITLKNASFQNGQPSTSHQANLILSKPTSPMVQLTNKSLGQKIKSESNLQKSSILKTPPAIILTPLISNSGTTPRNSSRINPSAVSTLKTLSTTTPLTNSFTPNIKLISKPPLTPSTSHTNKHSITPMNSIESLPFQLFTTSSFNATNSPFNNIATATATNPPTTTIFNNTDIKDEDHKRRSPNSPIVKFHVGSMDDDKESEYSDSTTANTTNNNCNNPSNTNITSNESDNKNVASATKDEPDNVNGDSKADVKGSVVKDDDTCSFFEALQELNEANKKVEEIEARLKEEEEEKERAKRIKQLLGQDDVAKETTNNNTTSTTLSNNNHDDDNSEKIVVDDDDDDDDDVVGGDYNNNNTINNHNTTISTINNNTITINNNNNNNLLPPEPTNIMEFGRLFNKRYLPQHTTTNKYNNVIYSNHNNSIINSNSNTLTGGISLLKSGLNFNRSYSILRPGDNVIMRSSLHPVSPLQYFLLFIYLRKKNFSIIYPYIIVAIIFAIIVTTLATSLHSTTTTTFNTSTIISNNHHLHNTKQQPPPLPQKHHHFHNNIPPPLQQHHHHLHNNHHFHKNTPQHLHNNHPNNNTTTSTTTTTPPPPPQQLGLNKEGLEDELEEEEMGHAETFAAYKPTKLKIGLEHPDAVVESASLSSVEAPDIEYQLSIPSECADQGFLSSVQLETITYACQKHENELPSGERVGFLIGDGAGVGKGRTIAGIIYENYLRGRRRSLWLSVSSDLKVDAERDLRDIGASSIPVYSLNKFKYTKISSKINGKVKKGVIFSTYSALIGESKANNKYRTRLKQLTHWLGKEFDGLIIFDECHRAKNLFPNGSSKPTKTGKTVVELQKRLPKSRVVYASATGASEPRNMAYMVRLGLWGPGTPFKEFADFIHAVEKRGVGTMEMVAMEMKQRGTYIARQLSFKGVSFRVEEVAIAEEYIDMYNQAVKLWVEAREKFQQSIRLLELDKHQIKVIWSQFWSSHQRFFKYLCISGKVEHCVALAKKAIADGKCVVIGLQSTGESRILDVVEEQGDELTDFVSSAKGVFQKLVESHFPERNSASVVEPYQAPTPVVNNNNNNKRKISPDPKSTKKRFKKADSSSDEDVQKTGADNSDEGSEDSSGDEEEDDDNDDDDDDDEDDNSSSESESDTNPFANGSDSDCDVPWLRRKKPKPEKKEKKKKVKKEKQKKEKDGSGDDSECEYDKDVNRILEALKKKESMEKINKVTRAPSSSVKTSTTTATTSDSGGGGGVEEVVAMKRDLLRKIDLLGDILPPNTLDQLIDLFEGPSKVAEMTGRKGRVVCGEDGSIRYEKRSVDDVSLEMLNLTEKQRFMDGEKNVAIISEAASSGISLQADRRAINQRRRVHITLELPWSADRAIQQFGRTHRSNQVSAPEYIFLISDLAGERRFASTVSKRLESLGALTHGDRRAAEARDLSQFNIDNKFGQSALEAVMKSVIGDKPLVPLPLSDPDKFFQAARESLVGVGMVYHNKLSYTLDKESYNISKFLNRILGIEVSTQNHLFNYFSATLKYVMLEAKKNGKWDMGILDLGSLGEKVMKLSSQDFYGFFSGSKTKITLNKVSVERGLSWKDAEKIYHNLDAQEEGFYISRQTYVKNRKMYILAQATRKHKETFFKIFRANTGLQTKLWSLSELRQKYKRVSDEGEVKSAWQEQFNLSEHQCLHVYQYAKCHNATSCEIGRRCRIYHILSGSVLSFWTSVERVLSSFSGQTSKMQIVRARMKDEKRIVGILINSNAINPLTQLLKTGHLDDIQSSPLPSHFHLQQPQKFIKQPSQNYFQQQLPQQKVIHHPSMYLQQQQQQQQLDPQSQQIKHKMQQHPNSVQNFVNYSLLSPFQKAKLLSQQQLQRQLQQQQQRLQQFNDSPSPNNPPKPRFVYSLSSSSLQQLGNNNHDNKTNNINNNNGSIKYMNNYQFNIRNNNSNTSSNHNNFNNNNNDDDDDCIIINNNLNNNINNINNINNLNNINKFNNINSNNNSPNNINNNKHFVIKPAFTPNIKTPSFSIVPAPSLNKPP